MREHLEKVLREQESAHQKVFVLREFLQRMFLASLDRSGEGGYWGFMGGTALRLLHQLPRFSEDLDFSLTVEGKEQTFSKVISRSQKDFLAWGFDSEVAPIKEKVVRKTFLKFPKLLQELRLDADPRKKLSIKIELDTNPPKGFRTRLSTLHQVFLFNILHFDLPSLFASKLHALLLRTYLAPRDIYDFIWYASQKIPINQEHLFAALTREDGFEGDCTLEDLKRRLRGRLAGFSYEKAKRELKPFFEDPEQVRFLSENHVEGAIDDLCFEERSGT